MMTKRVLSVTDTDADRLIVRIAPDERPQVTVYRRDVILGTASYGGPLGAVDVGLDWRLSDEEWHRVNALVGLAYLDGSGREVWVSEGAANGRSKEVTSGEEASK